MKLLLLAALAGFAVSIARADTDYSSLSEEQITQYAQMDAQDYFAKHNGKFASNFNAMDVGLAHAFSHHLFASQANRYEVEFSDAIDALKTGEVK
jgi:hypothetical protein